ncbi:MAG TPA: RDD family protein, partial [Candidatus Rifleibacterium sp.]|nr:RDD family protein [Candidatus Rifleibacterium sp.]
PINLASLFNFLVFLAAGVVMLIKDMPFQLGPLEGQTPGKKAMNIRVTDLTGRPITMIMSIRRNIIPALPLLVSAVSAGIYIIPIPVISELASIFIVLPLFLVSLAANLFEIYKIHTGDQNRRWGDTFAGTMVKHD